MPTGELEGSELPENIAENFDEDRVVDGEVFDEKDRWESKKIDFGDKTLHDSNAIV